MALAQSLLQRFVRSRHALLGAFGFCLSMLTISVGAQELPMSERMAVLERDVKGYSSIRDKLTQSTRPIRVLAVYSERAIGASTSATTQAKLYGIQAAALTSAATRTNEILRQHNVTNAQVIEGLPLVTFAANAEQLTNIAESGQFATVVEDRLAKPYLASSGVVMNVPQAHAAGARGAGQVVAVLDTGVDIDHPFLNGRVVEGACFSSNFAPHGATSLCPGGATSATTLNSGNHCSGVSGCDHGTHVAGIAAGRSTSAISFNGVAPDANVFAVQVFSRFDDQTGGPDTCASVGTASPCVLSYTSDQIRALQHVHGRASTLNIASVNMSLGGGDFASNCDASEVATKDVIDLLESVGIPTVIAAGNDGFRSSVGAPACISNAFTIGSTTDSDQVSSFSNLSTLVDLLAVGSSVDSSIPGTGTDNFNGTSMATPQVAGAIAALASMASSPATADILAALTTSGTNVTDSRTGGSVTKPRMDLETAVQALGGTPPSPAPSEDCTPRFDASNLRIISRGWWFWRTWIIAEGNRWLFSFGSKRNEAQQALNLIQQIGFDQSCFLGRPDASMQYLKRNGAVPNANSTAQDCISFNHATVAAQSTGGQWRMVDGSTSMLSFPSEGEARQAVALVKHHRMNRQCFVGRPGPSFTYWLAQ